MFRSDDAVRRSRLGVGRRLRAFCTGALTVAAVVLGFVVRTAGLRFSAIEAVRAAALRLSPIDFAGAGQRSHRWSAAGYAVTACSPNTALAGSVDMHKGDASARSERRLCASSNHGRTELRACDNFDGERNERQRRGPKDVVEAEWRCERACRGSAPATEMKQVRPQLSEEARAKLREMRSKLGTVFSKVTMVLMATTRYRNLSISAL